MEDLFMDDDLIDDEFINDIIDDSDDIDSICLNCGKEDIVAKKIVSLVLFMMNILEKDTISKLKRRFPHFNVVFVAKKLLFLRNFLKINFVNYFFGIHFSI